MNRIASYFNLDQLKGVYAEYCADERCLLHKDCMPMLHDLHRENIQIDVRLRGNEIEVGLIYSGRGAQYSGVFCSVYGVTRAQHGYHQSLPLYKVLHRALMVLPNLDNCPFDKSTKITLTFGGRLIMPLGEI